MSALTNPTFAALLRWYRGEAGMTQEELARRAGIGVLRVRNLELDQRRSPHATTVARLADALQLAEDDRRAFMDAAGRSLEDASPGRANPTFATLLRRYRASADMSQEALSARAGIGIKVVSDLERGRTRFPHATTVARLVEALRLTEDEGRALMDALRRPSEDALPGWSEKLVEGSMAGGTALATLLGSPDAMASLGITPVAVDALRHAAVQLHKRSLRNQVGMLAKAAVKTGLELDELMERLLDTQPRMELLRRSLEAAAQATDEKRLEMLAEALTKGAIGSDAEVDQELLVGRPGTPEPDADRSAPLVHGRRLLAAHGDPDLGHYNLLMWLREQVAEHGQADTTGPDDRLRQLEAETRRLHDRLAAVEHELAQIRRRGDSTEPTPSAAGRDGPARLTRREQEVADLIAHGLRNQQIADQLGLELPTVKSHVHSILAKLGVSSRIEAAVLASMRQQA